MARVIDLLSPGASLGQGLSTGLQQLAQHKFGELQQRQQASNLQNLFPSFNTQQASALSQLPPELQQLYIKSALEAPQQEAFAQALGQLTGTAQQPITQQSQLGTTVSTQPGKLSGKQALEIAKLQQIQQAAQSKVAQREKEAEKKDIAQKFKETKVERKEIFQKAQSAKQQLHDLNRIEELEKEGKLDTPGYVEFLKRSGLDIPALLNPGSEEFQKITQSFLRDAKQYFGSRVSNFELEQFLKTIPNLSQSPEGRKRVVANLKYLNRAALEYNDSLKEVLKENKGIPPFDILEQVDDKIDTRLDKLADKFKEDLKKPVPKGQNKFISGLQSALGSAVGIPGAIIGKIGNAAGHLLGG